LGPHAGGFAALGIPGDEARDSCDAQGGRRLYHIDRIDSRTARRSRAACLQRCEGGNVSLTRTVAIEVAKDRIRVNCICPGGINTPIFNLIPGGPEVVGQFLAHAQPIPRAGTPEDVAAMALFLASDESEWVTGTAMVVDGGLLAGENIYGRPQWGAFPIPPGFIGPSFEPR
jgi:hypothetical protein